MLQYAIALYKSTRDCFATMYKTEGVCCNTIVCCSVLQCVAVCCSVLQCVAVCCSMLQYKTDVGCRSVMQCVAVQDRSWVLQHYGVAMVSRLLKITGLFCRI